jgi:hypothetical protein
MLRRKRLRFRFGAACRLVLWMRFFRGHLYPRPRKFQLNFAPCAGWSWTVGPRGGFVMPIWLTVSVWRIPGDALHSHAMSGPGAQRSHCFGRRGVHTCTVRPQYMAPRWKAWPGIHGTEWESINILPFVTKYLDYSTARNCLTVVGDFDRNVQMPSL